MKKIYFLLCLLMMSIVGMSQQLLHEPFNYTPHATDGLATQSGGAWAIVNTGDSVLVTSGNLSYTGLPASTGNKISFAGTGTDYYTTFTTQNSGTVYTSFILNVSALGTINTTGGYFAGVIQAGSTSNFGATLWIRASATAGMYNLGINLRTTAANTSWLPVDLSPGTSYFIVTAYEMVAGTGNDVAKIWLNTTAIGGTEPTPDATSIGGTDLTSVGRFLIRQDQNTTIPQIDFDELRVGTTWASVTPAGTVPPTPTVTSLNPSSATAGDPGFTLTVNGTNFVSGLSTVTWNGADLPTTFVSSTQLDASVSASDIAVAGTANVGVTTTGAAAPSNTLSFTINAPASPTLTATALADFGDVCINTTASGSFTINGASLTTANITVGPLTGFAFATTSGGPFTTSLSLTQAGGNYSQQIFVEFNPVAVQSYDGNIPVSGGGATAITVEATGSGVNTAPSVTAGAATGITTSDATLPGTITNEGCSAISAYGIEYSTTAGFANGTGTQVPGANLSAGNFSVTLTTLSPNTTYYFKAYATNAGGTSYSSEQNFTTDAITPPAAPVATAATTVNSNDFVANWNTVTGATGYRLDVYTLVPGTVVEDVAGWNFAVNNATSQTADLGNVNNIGIQTITGVGIGTVSWPSGPSGATGSPNPYSVSANGWDNGANSKYWQIDLNTTGVTNLTLSSLQGSSNTGPSAFQIQYKVGASGTWTDVPGGAVSITTGVVAGNLTTWASVNNLPLPAAVDNQPLVSIRWISTSNTSVNGSTVASGGTSRISAIYVKGSVPGQVPSYVTGYQDLAVGNVTSYNVTGLTANTTYYYVVRAENAGGASANSNEIMVTTANGSIPTLTAGTLAGFGDVCINTTSPNASFTINGTNLLTTNVTVGPLAGFSFATTAGGPYTASLSIPQGGGTFTQQVFVQFEPTAVQSYDGDIPVGGGGAAAITVAATGSGINDAPSVTAGSATGITQNDATLPGTITDEGCSAITAYGIEYSTTAGFANGTGTQVPGTNLSSGSFSVNVTGLAAGTTYYYKAYATNGGGTTYSSEQNFTTSTNIPVAPVATTATVVGGSGFTANWNAVAGATNYRLDVYTLSGSGSVIDVAGWNFGVNNATAETADLGNTNNIGIATITHSGLNVISYPSGPSGASGSPNPYSISANGWDNGANTKYWQIEINTTGVSDITLSSLQGSSNTGPSAFKVQYMVGTSGTWTDIPGGTVSLIAAVSPGNLSTWGALTDLPLPAAVDNQPQVFIRWLSTSNTSVNNSTVAANGTSRISAIYVKGTSATGGTPVYVAGYQDLSVGNVTSYAVTGLTPGTTYYYVVRAENAGGVSPNSNEISVTTIIPIIPTITTTTLADFGNVCINTTASGSFTINGTNLTNANIEVGPLAGFSFATSASGPFTNTLSLTQGGGTYSQQIFVQFNPTAVQSYDGDIPVTGGGVAGTVNVAVTGSGVDAAPDISTGAATSITDVSAVLNASVADAGCTAITAHGFEYSTTPNFPNGTGTQVAGTPITGGFFEAPLSGLTPNTVYYFKAFATNAAGTVYGTEQSFTTLLLPPPVLFVSSALPAFGSACVGEEVGPNSFDLSGTNLTTEDITIGPRNGFVFATTAAGPYSATLTIQQSGGSFNQTIYVKFLPAQGQSYDGVIPVSGGGYPTLPVPVSATGQNTPPPISTMLVLGSQTTHSFRALVGIGIPGCGPILDQGIEYSGINNFTPGTGTKLSGGPGVIGLDHPMLLDGLVQGTTYYFRAYIVTPGGTTYGDEETVTLRAIPDEFTLYPVPVRRGNDLRFSANNIKNGYVGIEIYNGLGQQVYRKHFNVQNNFINDKITVPASLAAGVYKVRIVNDTDIIETKTILIGD